MESKILANWFLSYKEPTLYGRYIHLGHIKPLLDKLSSSLVIEHIGDSENNAPIHLIKLGEGSKKLLFWSQMHGNESTTTKAVFDFINMLLDKNNSYSKGILKECTLYIVPVLSPDGAKAYTRLNYNKIDLNRDSQKRSQKESKVLRSIINDIAPDFAFNLHGQRTIFSVGDSNVSATVSFLSPAGDLERSVTPCRKIAMEVIAEMNSVLQEYIPKGVGRYDDRFNINCIGDTLSEMKIPTILFEAGHYKNDYNREKTRELIFYALVTSVNYIAKNNIIGDKYQEYFKIPENGKYFYDIIIRDVILNQKNVDISIQYEEELSENSIKFVPKIAKIGDLQGFYGHREVIGKKRTICNDDVTVEMVSKNKLAKFWLNDELFSVEALKS